MDLNSTWRFLVLPPFFLFDVPGSGWDIGPMTPSLRAVLRYAATSLLAGYAERLRCEATPWSGQ